MVNVGSKERPQNSPFRGWGCKYSSREMHTRSVVLSVVCGYQYTQFHQASLIIGDFFHKPQTIVISCQNYKVTLQKNIIKSILIAYQFGQLEIKLNMCMQIFKPVWFLPKRVISKSYGKTVFNLVGTVKTSFKVAVPFCTFSSNQGEVLMFHIPTYYSPTHLLQWLKF